ncbi:MAG: TonB family protein [Halieaceae bacterium]|jgi:TonB family protein
MHLVLLAVVTQNWAPESSPTVLVTAKHVKAILIDAESLRSKPKPKPVVRPRPKPQVKTQPSQTIEPKSKPEPKISKPEETKVEIAPRERPEKISVFDEEAARKQAANEMSSALAAEDVLLDAVGDLDIAESHVASIARAIADNWSRPPSARNNMEAELVIHLIPTGDVVSVAVDKSSGSAAFDRSAVNAVQKAERFPELQQLPSRVFEKHFRTLRLKFRPEDLRQ